MQSMKRSDNIWFSWLLYLLFLGLKLGQLGVVATWSWWWVFAPIWGGVIYFSAEEAISQWFRARKRRRSCNQ